LLLCPALERILSCLLTLLLRLKFGLQERGHQTKPNSKV
jgi:hypothetical protein